MMALYSAPVTKACIEMLLILIPTHQSIAVVVIVVVVVVCCYFLYDACLLILRPDNSAKRGCLLTL